ncbi:hypothetical protein [Magnetospirillum gryphiswaldense]|uniref:Uncharacterized protein n=2 Tax=Magnetospirillum gryphiswaldense TaxID=55518 RepID=V6F676_MAGGM|nr:hypothetical protein [Magnetospirillum gryphiswaldense]AVM75144.1 hypothetical protein MSR1_26720 [Magnetospirillum gryphiswaldense MSR-1]AVM79047.1 hypothetical protein MSR1L_26720 [Magnetospirillum gryphiswaldense]CAM74658.1 Permeases of the major facilitator superfamily [Magnetospirillum gryphiswaldense MSR-1]CDL00949.1 protein of unknown function [Magnetospirillum gryphiswaldense MSR-1 v2]
MSTDLVYVTVASSFSQEVFRRIRPVIPRERWPLDAMSVTFTSDPSGLFLRASFDESDLPASYAQQAVNAIAHAGVDLVVKSPFAGMAAAVIRAARWRDVFLYLAVPLLFAIPLMGALLDRLMMPVAGLFGADILALALVQMQLTRRRMAIANARCVAEIPVPGMRVSVAAKSK